MTIVEFLHPLKKSSLRDICLAALYFAQRYESKESMTVEALRALLSRGRVAKVAKLNLADVLARSAPYVDITGKEGNRFLWSLTRTGQQLVRSMMSLPSSEPEIENDVEALREMLKRISDNDTADYVEEAIKCLSINALRASVVFLWAGAVKYIRESVMRSGVKSVSVAIGKYDANMRKIRTADDLVYLKESTLLLVAQELGLYDKNERGVLEECLQLRNKCGHPGKYKIGPKKVSSYIEDLVSVIFQRRAGQ